jgi:hypothetical protein
MKEEEGEKMIENVEILKWKNFFLWQVPKKKLFYVKLKNLDEDFFDFPEPNFHPICIA